MSFEAVIGHETAKRFFRSAWSSGRLGHAYLLHGPEGVGKRTFARAFARNLFCTSTEGGRKQADDSCGRCKCCRKIESGNHPDVSIGEGDSPSAAGSIDAIRRLRDDVHLRSVEGRWKLFVLDDVHRLRADAATALLKTLEEPPPGSILLLLATDLAAVQDTIRSRCHAIPFRAIPDAAIIEYLEREHMVSPRESRLVARMGAGSPGACVRFLGGGFLGELDVHRSIWLDRFIGEPTGRSVSDLLEMSKGRGESAAETRLWLVRALRLGIGFLRDMVLAREGVGEEAFSFLDAMTASRLRVDPIRAAELLDDVLQACVDVERNLSPAVVLADLDLSLRTLTRAG